MEPEPEAELEPDLEEFEEGAAQLVVTRMSPRDVSDLRKSTRGAEIDVFERVVMLSTELREADEDEGGNAFTVYRMRCFTKDDRAWDVQKRFSEFIRLRQQLIVNGETPVAKLKFPRKVLWGATDPKVVEKRMVGIQGWLNELLALGMQSLGLLLVWKFFEADGTAAQLADIQNNWRRRDKRFKALRSDWGAITAAAHSGEAVRLEMLLAEQHPEPADLDERVDKFGQTALHRAAVSGHTRCAMLLLDAGADPLLCNEFGQSALHLAARGGHAGVFRELLRRGSQLTSTDPHGNAVLHVAAQHDQKEIVHLALLAGADLNATTAFGTTPAEVAANAGHYELAELLDETSASPTLRAAVCESEAVARRLLAFGPPPHGVTHRVEVAGVRAALQALGAVLASAETGDNDRLQLVRDTLTAMYEASLAATEEDRTGDDMVSAEESVPPATAVDEVVQGADGVTERVPPLRLAIPKPAPWQQSSSPMPRSVDVSTMWRYSNTTVRNEDGSANAPSIPDGSEDVETGTEKWQRMEKEQKAFLHELDTDEVSQLPKLTASTPASGVVPAPARSAADEDSGSAPVVATAVESVPEAPKPECHGLPLVLDETPEPRATRSRSLSLRLSPRSSQSPGRPLSSSPSTTSASLSGSSPQASAPAAGSDSRSSPVFAGQVLKAVARDAMQASFTEAMAERGEQLASPRASICEPGSELQPQPVSEAGSAHPPQPEPRHNGQDVAEPSTAEPQDGGTESVDVDEDEYLKLPLVARVALEAAQSFDNDGKLTEAYVQYSKALRVSVPWLQANPEQANTLKPMLSVVFKRAFELRATHGGGPKAPKGTAV